MVRTLVSFTMLNGKRRDVAIDGNVDEVYAKLYATDNVRFLFFEREQFAINLNNVLTIEIFGEAGSNDG